MCQCILSLFLYASPGLQDKPLNKSGFGSEPSLPIIGIWFIFFLPFPVLQRYWLLFFVWWKWVPPVSQHRKCCYSGVDVTLLVLASTSPALRTYVPRVINAQSNFLNLGNGIKTSERDSNWWYSACNFGLMWQSFHALMVTLAFTV